MAAYLQLQTTVYQLFFQTPQHFMRKGKMTKMIKVMGNISRVFNIIMLPIALSMPSVSEIYSINETFNA